MTLPKALLGAPSHLEFWEKRISAKHSENRIFQVFQLTHN